MGRLGRPGISEAQRQELWNRWKLGDSLSDIAKALKKAPGSIHGVLRLQGGIVPRTRNRAQISLNLKEREEISRCLAIGLSVRKIALQVNRAASTISREIKRNGGRENYRATLADERATDCGLRPKQCKLGLNGTLKKLVAGKLKLAWSPEQIAGWCRLQFGDNKAMQISHETIYKSLYIQARGVLKKELLAVLRTGRKMRHAKSATRKGQPRGQIIDGISIHDRPPEIEDRAIPGHWEGDLITGSKNSHIATLVERSSRFTMLVKVAGKDTASVVSAITAQIQTLPEQLRKSLTWDRGMELAKHKQFTVDTQAKVYFCDPQSPWQRGTNENTNRLLRQYFPAGMELTQFSQSDLNKVAQQLNTRPRKTLGFNTPAAILMPTVAPTD
jgi:IS30 family transposase